MVLDAKELSFILDCIEEQRLMITQLIETAGLYPDLEDECAKAIAGCKENIERYQRKMGL